MKHTVKKIIAVILSVCLLMGTGVSAFAAPPTVEDVEFAEELIGTSTLPGEFSGIVSMFAQYLIEILNGVGDIGPLTAPLDGSIVENFVSLLLQVIARVINMVSNIVINSGLAGAIRRIVPGSGAVQSYEDFKLDEYAGFLCGMEAFNTEVGENNVWNLGYSEKSILPADFGEKSYARGAYLPNVYCSEMAKDDDGENEDLRVRTIAINDGSGSGTAVFAVIDAIGIANADVRLIRNALADFAEENNIVSINVSATHIHTGIDLQGIWTDPIRNLGNNITSSEVSYGVDRTFLATVVESTRESVIEAFEDMTEGRLMFSSTDISDYVHDRTAPYVMDTNLYKLEFQPFNKSKTPTIIASFGCHPESASYDWNSYEFPDGTTGYDPYFSADFIWYMEKVMNAAGYNFIYIQGEVGTNTSSRGRSGDNLDFNAHGSAVRYGYEMGYITLTLSMTEEERKAVNASTGDKLGVAEYSGREGYTVWYEDLETVPAEEVKPLLNIAHSAFTIKVENNLLAAAGKTSLTDNLVLCDKDGNLYTVTEVGYMELGDTLKVYLSPGETYGELLMGGDGLAGFPYPSLREKLGDNVIVFDLMNDAAGYVENDATFVYLGIQYTANPDGEKYDGDSWGIVSYGKNTGSTLIGKLYELVDSVK
ncbi:MAG: hypothetical protein IJS90_01515 [Clostridia bacterium]|nr:hypothetical protein [Clostridia bacterium]